VPGTVGAGSGVVTISDNLIQGNLAGAGDGGGLRLARTDRHRIGIYDNIIVNNMAGLAGGGISLYDAENTEIIHNTIAHNDSLATAGEAFSPGNPSVSNPQPAGIVAHEFSPALKAAQGVNDEFPTPKFFVNNIIWRNRAFHYGPFADQTKVPNYGLLPEQGATCNPTDPGAVGCAWDYWDIDVMPFGIGQLNPTYSVVTDAALFPGSGPGNNLPTNTMDPPAFVASYFTAGRRINLTQPEGISLAVVLDEGGNFIRPRVGPLTLRQPANDGGTPPADTSTAFFGNYHVTTAVAGRHFCGTVNNIAGIFDPGVTACAVKIPPALTFDFDNQLRWSTSYPAYSPDRGADQVCVPPSVGTSCTTYPVPTSPLPPVR
jgi:parallel beta-helix repeat protein